MAKDSLSTKIKQTEQGNLCFSQVCVVRFSAIAAALLKPKYRIPRTGIR